MAGEPSASAPPVGDRASSDEMWMSLAIECARAAGRENEVPVGAVVVRDGKILGEGNNRTIRDTDPSAHAELVAIRDAARNQGDWRLTGATLYVTLEPCAMCAGAIVLSRVSRVVFGAHDPKAGMGGSIDNLLQDRRLNHFCEVTSGVYADESISLLQSFFRERR